MKTQIASMIASHAGYTARRPDGKKHAPKVRSEVVSTVQLDTPMMVIDKKGEVHYATAIVKRTKQPHTVWRGGVEYVVTKGGLVPR